MGVAVRAGAVEAVLACVYTHAAAAAVQSQAFAQAWLYNLAARTDAPGNDAAARATLWKRPWPRCERMAERPRRRMGCWCTALRRC